MALLVSHVVVRDRACVCVCVWEEVNKTNCHNTTGKKQLAKNGSGKFINWRSSTIITELFSTLLKAKCSPGSQQWRQSLFFHLIFYFLMQKLFFFPACW